MPCPLCRSTTSVELQQVRFADIYDALAETWRVHLDDDIKRRHAVAETTSLVRCEDCGLDHFEPSVGGDADFYDALSSSPAYYSDSKWEFDLVQARIAPDACLVDLGAGNGAFLRSLGRTHVGRLVGVDVSPVSVAALRGDGFEAHADSFATFAAANAGTFDVVTGFHIVEHLATLDEFFTSAEQLLRPGGTLFVSTPNRERPIQDPLEPLDCPPHHLSRWSSAQLDEAAERYGLVCRNIHRQPPDRYEVGRLLERRIGRRPRQVLKAAGLVVAVEWVVSRRTAWAVRHGWFGLSILAEMTKQDQPRAD